MKILIVHKHLQISGVTKFYDALIRLLIANGHSVDFLVEDTKGASEQVFKNISSLGCNLFAEYLPKANLYDIAFYSYNNSNFLNNAKVNKYFVHGLELSDYELTTEQANKFNEIFVFGERAKEYYTSKSIETTLIRNFIDKSGIVLNKSNRELKKVVLFAARDCFALISVVSEICSKNNWYLRFLGKSNYYEGEYYYKDAIAESDLVVGIGRCMFESMALGKPVVNFGLNGGDGYVDSEETFKEMCITNGSGYSIQKIPSLFSDEGGVFWSLESQMKKYNCIDGIRNYQLIIENFDSQLFYDKIIRL